MSYEAFDYVRRIVPETSTFFTVPPSTLFPLAGASIDLWFAQGLYYAGGTVAVTDELSISRASVGYVSNSDGTLTQFTNDTLRIGVGTGLLVEGTRTNVALWSRDLTNAVWAPTNITPLKDQTGPDGVVNSASSILATAGNGTILQAITDASSIARFQSAYVKRLVGSGTINMTMDNGATWTAITVTSNWTLVSIPTQTLANPTVGFQIVTSGDKIAVDFVQNENGTSFSSPIPTTTTSAARAADDISCIGNLDTLLRGSSLSIVMDSIAEAGSLSLLGVYLGQLSPQNAFFYTGTATDVIRSVNNGANVLVASAASGSPLVTGGRYGYADDATGRSLVISDGLVVSDAFRVAPTGTVSMSGSLTGNANFTYFRRLIGWNSRLADAALQGYVAP